MFKVFVRTLAGAVAVLGVLSILPMVGERASAQGRFRPNLPPRNEPNAIRPSPPGIFGQAGQAGVGGTGGVAGISGSTSGAIGGGITGISGNSGISGIGGGIGGIS